MLSDFERVANLRQGGEQATAAAFHVALCYILGFGTKVEYSTATQYLRKAEENAHPLAQLFAPRLLSRISNLPNPGLLDYTSIIAKGFRMKRFFSKSTKILLTTVTEKSKDQELKGLELDTDATQPHSFSNFQELRDWLVAFIRWKGDLTRWQVTIGTGPKMNFVECAIAFEDAELLSQLLNSTSSDWDKRGAWGETPLIQATRRGNANMVSLILDDGHNPCQCDESGTSVYHWLFQLTVGNEETVVESLFARLLLHPNAGKVLEDACTTPFSLHAQWPLQLVGTPLAFAVMSRSLKTVEVLLRRGVHPKTPVYAAGEDGVRSKWTALHLATKYHFAEILTVLVQKAGELIRASDDPLEELGIAMVNSKNPYRRREWKGSEIPEELLAEALLEFQDLQLPCVLGHVTIVERYGIHGMNYSQSIRDILDILPSKSLEWRSSDGQTALMQAIDYNDYDLASVLLDRSPSLASADFRDPAEKGAHTYPFHFACQIASRRDSEESTDIASRILQLHPSAIRDRDSRLRTALHMSVTGPSSRVTRFLLFHGSPIDAEDEDGASALHYARSLTNVVALLDQGANIDYTNAKGLAAVHLAASVGADDIVAELVERGAKLDLSNNDIGSPLHCAVIRKSRASVYSLVQGNAPINARDRIGSTPLILAARSGRNDIVQILLDGGAEISHQNEARITALRSAILAKSAALVEKLLNHDVSHIAQETSSQSLLHLAAEQGDAATMKALLENIPEKILSVNAVNGTLQTPLHVAALAARADVAEVILEHNPKVNALDAGGATPLLLACRSSKKMVMDANGNRTEFIDLLIGHGATLTTWDTKGLNPWILARKYQDFNLMAYILERLYDMNCLSDLIYKDPPDRQLIEWAVQQEEWDFITICLRTGAITSELLPATLVHETATSINRLYSYARRGDKTMVQWVFEASRNGSLSNNAMHTGLKYTGMRNLYLEFHESMPASDRDIPFPAAAPTVPDRDRDLNPRSPTQKEGGGGSHLISNLLSGLRRKKSSAHSSKWLLPHSEDSGPSSSSDLPHLSPTSPIESSAQSPQHLRTPSLGSSFDTLLNRVSSGRNGAR
jgi:ankyrin repeat protein